MWRKCKKKDGDKELERGFKRSNILGKIGCKKKNKIPLFREIMLFLWLVLFEVVSNFYFHCISKHGMMFVHRLKK